MTPAHLAAQVADRSRRVIRTSGEVVPIDHPINAEHIRALLGADTLDTVNLRHLGEPLIVMSLNDRGYKTEPVQLGGVLHLEPTEALLPVNEVATAIYHANCKPGTTHQIVGDVFICPDEDFA